MDYFKAFDKVKKTFAKIDVPAKESNFAVQVNLTDDDCGGIFYIEMKDKQLFVEPYDYFDNNAVITAKLKDLTDILEGKLSSVDAVVSGKITVDGDKDQLIEFINSFKQKAVKKPAAKKAVKKTEKTAEKKPVKKPVKKAAPKAKKAEKTAPKTEKVSAVKEATVSKKSEPEKTAPVKKAEKTVSVKEAKKAAPAAKSEKSTKTE